MRGLLIGVAIGLIVAGIPAFYFYQGDGTSAHTTQTQSLIVGNENVTWNFAHFLANSANAKNPSVIQEILSLPHRSLIINNTQIQRLSIWTFTPSTFGFIAVQFSNSSTGYAILSIQTLNTTSGSSSQTEFYSTYLAFRSPNGTGYYPTIPSTSFPTLPSSEVRVTLVAGTNSSNSINPLGVNVPFSMNVNVTYYQL